MFIIIDILSHVLFPLFFTSWANGELHHSGFKSQIVALYFMMYDVSRKAVFLENQPNFVVVLFPYFLTFT
jgi:hypothetical protein